MMAVERFARVSTSGCPCRGRKFCTNVGNVSLSRRWDSAAIVSNTSDDFPEPETPVKTVILRRGMSTEMFWRLFSRAPRTWMAPGRSDSEDEGDMLLLYFKRYTTVVSVSAGSGVGSPYISHECPADSLRFAAIHFRIASCASFIRSYGPRWTATAASPCGVSVAYTSPAVSNVRVTSTPKSHSIGAPGCVG